MESWGGGDETVVCEVLQPSIYDSPLHVCFPVEWKGGHAGLRGSQAALGQGMWRKRWDPRSGGGRRPTPWTLHCERETDNHKLIPTFLWIISSFSFTNPLLPYFSPPHFTPSSINLLLYPRNPLFFIFFTPFQLFKLLKLRDPRNENCCSVAYLVLPPAHLHLIKTSETTDKSLGVWTVLIFWEHMAL